MLSVEKYIRTRGRLFILRGRKQMRRLRGFFLRRDCLTLKNLKSENSKKCLHSFQKCAIIYWLEKSESLKYAPLAQMDRAQASDAWCRRFESAMVRQTKKSLLALFYLVFHGPLLDRTQFCLQNCRRGANRLLYLIHRFPLAPKFGSESAYIPLNPPRIP